MESRQINFGSFTLDRDRRRLLRRGAKVHIGGRALDLLLLLTSRPGTLFSVSEITSAVWCKPFVDETNVRSQVATLRRALGDIPRDPQYIDNVPGRGYRFAAEIEGYPSVNVMSHAPIVDQGGPRADV